jgi:hypothetical protein
LTAALAKIVTAADKLDHLCADVISEFGGTISSAKDRPMPEIGGKSLAASLRESLAGAKKLLDEAKIDAAGAVTEVVTEAKNMKEVAKRIRAEAAEMRSVNREILGNESADLPGTDANKL